MQVTSQAEPVGPVVPQSFITHQPTRIATNDQGLAVVVPGSNLFPDFSNYLHDLDSRRGEITAKNSQAVADAKAAVDKVISYYGSIGVTPKEGARDIDVQFDPKFPNAAYDPQHDRMIIGIDPRTGDSFADSSPDVVAHELGHRVATDTGVLDPKLSDTSGENGAVQEHIADVFAVAYDKANWTIGEVGNQKIRDFKDPHSLGHPETVAELKSILQRGGKGIVVDEQDQYGNVQKAIDWHNVAEIPNHAAYEIGTAIGRDDLAKLYLNAMRKFLGPNDNLSQFAKGIEQSAADIYGKGSKQDQITEDAFVGAGLLTK